MVEIIAGFEPRRRWRLDGKLRVVGELEQPGACFAEVARRHDVSRGLLRNWRWQVCSAAPIATTPSVGVGQMKRPRSSRLA